MPRRLSLLLFQAATSIAVAALAGVLASNAQGASAALVGWSDVGLHEYDGRDVSVYSLLPPYSTIRAQLILGGLLVTNAAGVSVTYQAVVDAGGSINTTSQGKGNFYQYASALYGTNLAPDQGLAGFGMPGAANQPQPMTFDPTQNCFAAVGIPITPYDDQGRKNPFPLMRLIARNASGTILASTDIVLPVTDEMDCRICHASGTETEARPMAGWAWDCDADRDTKLNILRKHDDHFVGTAVYSNILSLVGYNTAGLAPTVTHDGKPISCVRCHASDALPGSGAPGMRPLTQLMHTKHAYTRDPATGLFLNNLTTSAACYTCHSGAGDSYERGIHRHTIATNGSLAMQCQSCHGKMTAVGVAGRQGWLDEPQCQSCHTGTATSSGGQLRYTSVFDATGTVRLAADLTFATQTNQPAAGLALYQSSQGHGGLLCAACHGAAHAELPSAQANDNVQSQQRQGHAGVLADCTACHTSNSLNPLGGPHGLHPVGPSWASEHENPAQTALAQCRTCHGANDRGTALSWMLADRSMRATENGTNRLFWSGSQIGCYNCHNGASGDGTGDTPAVASAGSGVTLAGTPISIPLQAAPGSSLVYRVVSTPGHGTVSLSNNVATYFPSPGFVGNDSFTFTAWNGSTDSTLGTVNVTVNPGACSLVATATAPTAALPNAAVAFRASAILSGCLGNITYDWDFGDGSPHSSATNDCHVYAAAGDYPWTLTVSANEVSRQIKGMVSISPTLGPPVQLSITSYGFMVELAWVPDEIPVSLETSMDLSQPDSWTQIFDLPTFDGTRMTLWQLVLSDQQYFRLRRVP